MSTQLEAVKKQVEYVGASTCDICNRERADVMQFKAGLFTHGRICDTCCGLILRGFDPNKGGDAD